MEERNLTCIVCPVGCRLQVKLDNGCIEGVSGNKCKRGSEYAQAECMHPVRTLTSTVKVADGKVCRAPVKSDKPVPRQLLFECMEQINQCSLQAPVHVGDIVIHNIFDTGIDIVATSNIPRQLKMSSMNS